MQRQYSNEELEKTIEKIIVKFVKRLFEINDKPRKVQLLLEENNGYVEFDDSKTAYMFHDEYVFVAYTEGKTKKIGSVEITSLDQILPDEIRSIPIFEGFLPVEK